jgi:hypothetical protein
VRASLEAGRSTVYSTQLLFSERDNDDAKLGREIAPRDCEGTSLTIIMSMDSQMRNCASWLAKRHAPGMTTEVV